MRLIENIVNLVAPLHCIYCDLQGSIICDSCLEAELINLPSCCFYCSKITQNFSTCLRCAKDSSLNGVWCVSDYNATTQSIIHAYKYDSMREVRRTISNEMLKVLPKINFTITNIPTASKRVRQRGFDHCSMLAKEISMSRKLNYYSMLYRTSPAHQVGSTKKERLQQTKNLFYVKNKDLVEGKRILLIDDIATTGATIHNAARALKNAGAKEIYGLVFAKKM